MDSNVKIRYINKQRNKIYDKAFFKNNIEFPKEYLSKLWNEFDWKNAEKYIFNLQCQLAEVAKSRNLEDINYVQTKITNSVEAKMLAVKKVSENCNSAGIDRVRWRTSSEKMRAAIFLNDKDYEATPLRNFVLIDKKTGKERTIGVPTLRDRAMHYLYTLALDPISEVWADYKSFGFRKGRSTFNAHAHLINTLNSFESECWVLEVDVESYYGSINHDWLLHNIPMDRNVLSQFLKAGIVFENGELFPTETGISLGCSISPILGNMVLDGIQTRLYSLQGETIKDYKNGWCIRYADDMIVLARSKQDAMNFREIINDFLEERGLKLSLSKTKIFNLNLGEQFTFLSRTYYKKGGIVHCVPSKKSKDLFRENLREMLFDPNKKWTPRKLVFEINQKLNGWASYHRITEAKDAFAEIDSFVSAVVLKLMKKIFPTLTKKQIINRFYWKAADGRYNFALASDRSCRILNLVDVILIKSKEIDTKKNYYTDNDYFKEIENNTEVENITGRFKQLWHRQNGKCEICGKPIQDFEEKKVIFKKLSKDKTINNMMYIHSFCEDSELVYAYGELGTLTPKNTMDIINELQDIETVKKKKQPKKFDKLKDYFSKSKKKNIVLTFKNIEEILGFKLPNQAYVSKKYFSDSGYIAYSWTSQNYELTTIDMKKQKLSFQKFKNNNLFESPKWFDKAKLENLPLKAIIELNEFLKDFERRYEL